MLFKNKVFFNEDEKSNSIVLSNSLNVEGFAGSSNVECSINNKNLLYRNNCSVYSLSYLNQLKEILHLSSAVNTDDILAIVNRLIKYLKKNNKGVSASCVRSCLFKGNNLRPSPKIGIHSC